MIVNDKLRFVLGTTVWYGAENFSMVDIEINA